MEQVLEELFAIAGTWSIAVLEVVKFDVFVLEICVGVGVRVLKSTIVAIDLKVGFVNIEPVVFEIWPIIQK